MLPATEPSLMHNNRAFCYGDAIFETIHANGTKMQFFDEHYRRLEKSMHILKFEESNRIRYGSLESYIIRLLNKNHLYNGVRVRLTIFRNPGGLYTPETNAPSFLIETSPLLFDKYRLNEKGLKTGLFTDLQKQTGILANLKTANSLLFILAGLHKKENGLDDCILMNTETRLAESISSNLFIMKKGTLITPALEEGCVAGVMRCQILRIASKEGIECNESQVSEDDLLMADECFLTNAIAGIRWVVAYKDKRYYSKTARLITASLNNEQFGK